MVSNDTLIQHTVVSHTVSGVQRTQLLDSIKNQLVYTITVSVISVISFGNFSYC